MARLVVQPGWVVESRRHRIAVWTIRFLAMIIAILLLVVARASVVRAATPNLDAAPSLERLESQLETGQFAPAIATASQLPRDERDQALARIARAQAAANDRTSAFQTASMIVDDRTFTDTLAELPNPKSQFAARGGVEADFESLIELIQSVIAPTTWDTVGGPGAVQGFEGGIHIDADGVLRPLLQEEREGQYKLASLRKAAREAHAGDQDDVRQNSPLRKISLSRLERQIQLLAAQGRRPTEEMRTLAGLQRIKYVLIYPETRDIVLAGPAGDWQLDGESRLVSTERNKPIVRLDDLVVILRHMLSSDDARFGCSITPTAQGLADVQAFVDESTKAPLKVGQRDRWLKALREKLGRQTIEISGIDPRTRVAQVLVEADYRMKLVGMGLEQGVLGVPSYLQMIEVPPGEAPPPMDVLRWWFTLNYDAVVASPERDVFELKGQGVKVLSENELLTAQGQRIHTGKSDALNSQFAHNFTKHFEQLAQKYPVYAELRNLCDLALVGAIIRNEHLAEKAGWQMLGLGDDRQYPVELGPAPKSVDSIINHRVINQKHIVVGVSGGVRIDPTEAVTASKIKTDDYGLLQAQRTVAAPKPPMPRQRWWWD